MNSDAQALYDFLDSVDKADGVCLKCRTELNSLTEGECWDDHSGSVVSSYHDNPGVSHYLDCLEYLDETGIIDIER